MSRLKKEKKRIKLATCGLALALTIGLAQGLGTYALFSDTEDVTSKLAISTGDVDVGINQNKPFENIEPSSDNNSEVIIPVIITNNGTLNQNIKLDLKIPEAIQSHIQEVEYIFEKVNISNSIMYNKGQNSLFVLSPGGSIEGTIRINIKSMDRNTQNELSKIDHTVEVKVKATQISNSNEVFNNGFYDEVTQTNIITIAQKEGITIVTGGNAHFVDKHGWRFKQLYIPVNIKSTNQKFELSATAKSSNNNNPIEYKADIYNDGTRDYILIQSKVANTEIEFQTFVNITIKVTVKDNENKVIDEYELKCYINLSNAGNDCHGTNEHPSGIDDKHCHPEIVNNGHKTITNLQNIIESPKGGVEVPSEPEVVEPPKEEIEVPREPEIVEPPKEEVEAPRESEVVEPPKEEIVEIPKQSEVIEPPKVNEGIQE